MFLLWGGCFVAVAVICTWVLPSFGYQFGPFGLAGAAVPGAIAFCGLVEVISGVPFRDLARRWDSLKGWQRGVLGTLIALAALIVVPGGVLAVVMLFVRR